MNEEALIQAPPQPVAKVQLTAEALAMREAALEAAALVGRVSNAEENEKAVEAQAELKRVSSGFEKARTTITKPLLDAQREIKAKVDAERKELEQELLRISRLIGDFQTLELQRQRAAEAARREEQTKLERERQEALAKAKSHDEVDAVQNHYQERAAVEAPPPPAPPTRATGQIVRTDWEVTRINDFVLAKARPDLVRKIEFDMAALKDCLKRGEKLPGVEAKEVVKASVRTTSRPLIEV